MTTAVSGRVSYVVPSYNYASFVAKAISSLLDQTYSHLEVIVVDDASTDGTTEVLSRFQGDPRVRIVRHELNRGHIATYNEGLTAASGEFLGLLSADDFLLAPTAVERMVELFRGHPNVGFVYGAHSVVDINGRSLGVNRPESRAYVRNGAAEFERLTMQNYVSHSGTLVRRSCHDAMGWYEPTLPHAADWDLWLRLCARYDVAYLAEPLFAYRIHDANMSHRTIAPGIAMKELDRVLDRNFARLPPGGEEHWLEVRKAARQHAVLFPVWLDLGYGRRVRACRGIVSAAIRRPSLLAARPFWGTLRRAGVLVFQGESTYQQRFGGFMQPAR